MNTRELLEHQSNRIEAVLSAHRIQARVTGGTVTPRWVRFQVLPEVGAKISKIKGLNEELAAALTVSGCRISRRGAAIDVEVPRDDPLPVQLMPLYCQLSQGDGSGQNSIPPATGILGLAEDGAPLLLRLPSPDVAHVLVAGMTGAGKTNLLRALAISLALCNDPPPDFLSDGFAAGLKMVLIDLSSNAFDGFERLPHLARPVVRRPSEATETLHSLLHLMQAAVHEQGLVKTIVFVDELADVLQACGDQARRALATITQQGREAGIHIIAGTRELANVGQLINRFPVRLVGQVEGVADARIASGWSGTGAERLTGRGDFLAVAEGQVIRFQAAHVSPDEVSELVAFLVQNDGVMMPVAWSHPLRQLSRAYREER